MNGILVKVFTYCQSEPGLKQLKSLSKCLNARVIEANCKQFMKSSTFLSSIVNPPFIFEPCECIIQWEYHSIRSRECSPFLI